MQIHRFHTGGQPSAPSNGVRKGDGSAKSGSAKSASHETEAGGAEGGGELDQLTRRLSDVSEVRAGVVAEAKVRLQRGDYLTRAAAEKTADALLSKDA